MATRQFVRVGLTQDNTLQALSNNYKGALKHKVVLLAQEKLPEKMFPTIVRYRALKVGDPTSSCWLKNEGRVIVLLEVVQPTPE